MFASGNCGLAQITPDNTLGADERSLIRANVEINGLPSDRIDGGAQRGANLFHSFREFNIDPGRGAYFTNPAGIENILSRVTGGDPSNILGTLGVTGGNANLFLLNPNGIVFGPSASLDVGGAFVATTANAIQFGDQGFFSAAAPDIPPLLAVNPSAFLFNQIAAQPINSIENQGFLSVPSAQSLLLVGGNPSPNASSTGGVLIDGGALLAPGGRVELGGVAGVGTVGLSADSNNLSLSFPDELARADVSLTNGAFVDVTAGGGGSIAVNARNLEFSGGSALVAGIGQNLGAPEAQAGSIEINATERVRIEGEADSPSSRIANLVGVGALGNAGNVVINAGSFEGMGNFAIGSSTFGQGDAGRVTIAASGEVSFSGGGAGSGVASAVGPSALGNGADIIIEARSLNLSDSAQLATSTLGQGNAGNIRVNASGSISLNGGSLLQALTGGPGNAGKIIIEAEDATVSFDGVETAASTSVGSALGFVGTGLGGDITITAKSLSVTNGAQLFTSTNGQAGSDGLLAHAGNILIKASDFVTVSGGSLLRSDTFGEGDAGNVMIEAGGAVSFDGVGSNGFSSGVLSSVGAAQGFIGDRQGGDINIMARSFSLTNGAQLGASTFGQGDAGGVTIQASDVSFDGVGSNGFSSGAFSNVEAGAVGNAGSISIRTGLLSLTNGASLNSNTFGQGNAGSVSVQADGAVSLVNANIFSTVEAGAVGNAGGIVINTGSLSLADGAQLSSSTFGQGNAGDISVLVDNTVLLTDESQIRVNSQGTGNGGILNIRADSLTLDNRASLSAATASGEGGNVELQVTDLLLLQRSSEISAEASGIANGGNIDINASFVAASASDNSDIIANAARGQGGEVQISAQGVFGIQRREQQNDLTSDITASSELGPEFAGVVEINTPDVDLQSSLTQLSANFVSPDQVVAGSCLARRNIERGSFTVTGTGGLPRSPYGVMSGPYSVTGVQPIQGSGPVSKGTAVVEAPVWKPGDPVQEAQGMVVTVDGRTIIGTAPQLVAVAKAQDLVCQPK